MGNTQLRRFEGRLFAEAGVLFMVVEANVRTGVARVSCRLDGRTQVIEMSLADVARHLSSGTDLVLDNLNSPDGTKRILRKKDGWFFSAREGLKGPFRTGKDAERELGRYILSKQSAVLTH